MRRIRWVVIGSLAAQLWGCRDEQAGPRTAVPPSQSSAALASQGPAEGSANQAATTAPNRGAVLDAAPKDLTYKSGATWGGGAVVYLGSKLEPSPALPGQPLKISHYFKALKAQPQGWNFFVHLVEPQKLDMLANLDHEIQGGAMPLGKWPEGKVIEDVHGIMIPQGFNGSIRLLMGFWQGDQRLPVDDAQAQEGTNRMLGPLIETAPPPGASSEVPTYSVKRAKKAPQIDGDLADPAWADAAPVDLVGSFDGRQPRASTTARLLYDDQHLYVSFRCQDPNIWGTLFKRDDSIYTQEAVEAFIDADGDGKTYNEIEVSPNNTLFDAYFPARREGMDLSWDSGVRSAVKFKGTINNPSDQDEEWTVELAIPIAKLANVPRVPPKKGDVWRFNLYRLDGEAGRAEGMAFSPLFVGDFHHLPRFGRLSFE